MLQKAYWFASENDDDIGEVQILNVNYVPSDPKQSFPKDAFLDKVAPEPESYTTIGNKPGHFYDTQKHTDRCLAVSHMLFTHHVCSQEKKCP